MDRLEIIIPIMFGLYLVGIKYTNSVYFKGVWLSQIFEEDGNHFYYHFSFANSSDVVRVEKFSDHYCVEEFEVEFKSSIQNRVIYFFHQEQKFRLKYFYTDIIKLKHNGKRIRFVRRKNEKH